MCLDTCVCCHTETEAADQTLLTNLVTRTDTTEGHVILQNKGAEEDSCFRGDYRHLRVVYEEDEE